MSRLESPKLKSNVQPRSSTPEPPQFRGRQRNLMKDFDNITSQEDIDKKLPRDIEYDLKKAELFYNPTTGILSADELYDKVKDIIPNITLDQVKDSITKKSIKTIYYNPKLGFMSAGKLHKKMQALGYDISENEINDVLERQESQQIFKQVRITKNRFQPIVSPALRNNYQMDLLDVRKFFPKRNENFSYLMVVIDVYSRYAVVIPIKSKEVGEVLPAFRRALEKMGVPRNLNTDLESAFMGKEFQNYLVRQDIFHWANDPDLKRNNMIVERFNRTIRELLAKYFYSYKTTNYSKVLEDVVENYNSRYQDGIDAVPEEIWYKKKKPRRELDEMSVGQKNYQSRMKLKEGDVVRVLKKYANFTKKTDEKSWSKNLWRVVALDGQIKTGQRYSVKREKDGEIEKRLRWELQKVDETMIEKPDIEVDTNQRKEFKEARKLQKARDPVLGQEILTEKRDRTKKQEEPKPTPPPPKEKKKPDESIYKVGKKVLISYDGEDFGATIVRNNKSDKSIIVKWDDPQWKDTKIPLQYKVQRDLVKVV